jgi:SHS2 domain-containing protein
MVTRARDPGVLAREIEHTADLGLEVEAPTLALVFERAALAVLALMVDLATIEARERAAVAVEGAGLDEVLHDWLQDLVVRVQTGGIVACEVAVEHADGVRVRGVIAGERVDPSRHRLYTEIKGVTYHQLAVRERGEGWWARVILDV